MENELLSAVGASDLQGQFNTELSASGEEQLNMTARRKKRLERRAARKERKADKLLGKAGDQSVEQQAVQNAQQSGGGDGGNYDDGSGYNQDQMQQQQYAQPQYSAPQYAQPQYSQPAPPPYGGGGGMVLGDQSDGSAVGSDIDNSLLQGDVDVDLTNGADGSKMNADGSKHYINWKLWGGVGAGVILAGIATYVVIKKRKKGKK